MCVFIYYQPVFVLEDAAPSMYSHQQLGSLHCPTCTEPASCICCISFFLPLEYQDPLWLLCPCTLHTGILALWLSGSIHIIRRMGLMQWRMILVLYENQKMLLLIITRYHILPIPLFYFLIIPLYLLKSNLATSQ